MEGKQVEGIMTRGGGIYIFPPRHIPLPLFSILKNFKEYLIVYY